MPLRTFGGMFTAIKFTATGNGERIVSEYVVNNCGYVESVAEMPCVGDFTNILPLTPNSHMLYAGVPVVEVKPHTFGLTSMGISNPLLAVCVRIDAL